MNKGYDVDGTGRGDGGPALDVVALLEDASWPGQRESLDPHEHWSSGRRRRGRKRAGAGVLGGVALAAVAGLVWQAGVFGGEAGPLEPHVATVPTGLTTFVLAAPDAPDVDPNTISALRVATEQDLNDTSWTLLDDMWGTDRSAPEVVGSDAETVFSFPDPAVTAGWGFLADECGGGWFQDGLSLTTEGAFDAGGNLATDDQGCPAPAQTAEDFWLDVLPSGGSLHLLGGHWLLLSVDTSAVGVEQAPPTAIETGTDAPSTAAGTAGEAPSRSGGSPTAAPTPSAAAPPTVAPTGPTTPATATTSSTPASPTTQAAAPVSPSAAPSTPADPATPTGSSTPPTSPAPDSGPAFLAPDEQWVGEPWPASGGGIYAPNVRAGAHDGFDRIVLDLAAEAGASGPGWFAVYTPNPLRDGSGLPMAIAGDSVLEVVLNSMAYPEPGDPVYDDGDFGLDTHRLGVVEEVIRTTPWEGQIQLFIGMQGEPRPYRVFLLQDPLRLVVDVQTS